MQHYYGNRGQTKQEETKLKKLKHLNYSIFDSKRRQNENPPNYLVKSSTKETRKLFASQKVLAIEGNSLQSEISCK